MRGTGRLTTTVHFLNARCVSNGKQRQNSPTCTMLMMIHMTERTKGSRTKVRLETRRPSKETKSTSAIAATTNSSATARAKKARSQTADTKHH